VPAVESSERPLHWLAPLKPWLVPVWNAIVHRLRALAEFAASLARGRIERCAVCGRTAVMILRPRVIPDRLAQLWQLAPRQRAALARKESLDCSLCGAKLRARRLAQVLLDTFTDSSAPPASSVREWVETPYAQQLDVAEINPIDGLHAQLARLPRLACSEFRDPHGTETDSTIPHEDLTRLTYPDASFDLVLTSETLEHVPDLARALAEIRRVLKPGGRHVFTIPVLPGTPRTFPRARRRDDGLVEHLATPISHPGGDVGYPVFTEFGADLAEIFSAARFESHVRFGPVSDDDLAQVYVCTRLGDGNRPADENAGGLAP
jgi:SAM-dependent methyltransferase